MNSIATLTAVLSAILWGLAYVASGEALKRTSPAALYLSLVGAAVVLAPVALWFEAPVKWPGAAAPWRDLVLASFSAVIALWLGYVAIANSSALQASIIDISYPLFAALAAWLIYDQKILNGQTLLGGAFILIGGAIILFSEKP